MSFDVQTPAPPEDMIVARKMARLVSLETEYSSFRAHHKELAENILPRHGRFASSDRKHKIGTVRNDKIVNNTATKSLGYLASGLMAFLTSPARPWFRLATPFPELNTKNPRVRAWLEETRRVMLEIYARSNIYNVLASTYKTLGCFGTAAAYIGQHDEDVLRAATMPVGSYFLAMNEWGQVNTLYRQTTLTVEQVVRKFGLGPVTPRIAHAWENGRYDELVEVAQSIEPNDLKIPGRLDYTGMPWKSCWWETFGSGGETPNRVLGYGGFHEFPVLTPRWDVEDEDVYGSSPGMEALGDIKGLQHIERKRARALDKIVDPAMNAPASLRRRRKNLRSGGVTYTDQMGGNQKFEPSHVVDPKVLYMKDELERYERRISSTLYADLFLMLANSGGPQKTAREVDERHEEKMLQLGPVSDRLQDELLDKLIDRSFGLAYRAGKLPEVPEELLGVDLRVEYISLMAQAQKLIATVGLERLASFIINISEVYPEARDVFDADKSVRDMGDMLAVSPELMNTKDEVAQKRAERAERQAMQPDQAGAIRDLAAAGRDVAETDLSDKPALQQMLAAQNAGGAAPA